MKSLEELRAAFKRNENDGSSSSGFNNYYPFWNLDFGQSATIRFLPDKDDDNPLGFLVEKHTHNLEINGEKKKIPCLKMYNEDCPICKVSSDYYKSGDEDNGKKYWKKRTYIAQALIIDDPIDPRDGEESQEGEVRYISMGYQLYNVVKEAFESGDLDEIPFAYKGGYNFVIKKTEQGKWATYAVGSRFVRRATDLTEDEIEFVESEMIELNSLLPDQPDAEKVEGQLQAALTGQEYKENKEEVDTPRKELDEEDTKVTSVRNKKVEKILEKEIEDEKEESSDGDDEYDDEADEILSRIRSRKSK
jgi:hypothetical protein